MTLPAERKAVAGADHVFTWRPSDGYPSTAPTLTVRWATPQAYATTPVRAADTVTAYDHANARLTITVGGAIAGAVRGILPAFGEAWLDGGPDFQGPVRVVELVSDGPPSAVLQLAEPLPRAVDVDGTWTLRYLTHKATLTAAHVGTARLRSVLWTMPYTRATGTDAPTLECVDRGVVHVVPAEFATGLTDEDLYALVPGWSRLVPERQSSWAEQRDAALLELAARLRPKLPAGRYEDDTIGGQWREVHALLTAATVRRGHALLGYEGAAEDAATLVEQAEAALARVLARVTWLDLDDDGLIDTGETDAVASLSSAGVLRSHVTASTWDADAADARRVDYWDPR